MSAPHYADDTVTLHHGDALEVLRALPDASVDAVVTDPPYGLEFMGREWDSFKPSSARVRTRVDQRTNPAEGKSTTTTPEAYVAGVPFQRWCEVWARECLRVLKPGGHLLAFGGTRTWHRLVCAIEDAGFEIRDSIAWLYGSGFPKSLDVSKAIDKAAGAEREVVGSRLGRPGVSADGANQGYGFGRVHEGRTDRPQPALDLTAPATDDARRWSGWGTALKPGYEPIVVARKPFAGTVAANVLAHGTGALNVAACRVESTGRPHRERSGEVIARTAMGGGPMDGSRAAGTTDAGRWPTNVVLDDQTAAELDQQSGTLTSGANPTRRGSDKFRDAYGEFKGQAECVAARGADSGGASRFFPTFRYEAKAPTEERPVVNGVAHPTVKPLDLMRWLVRLVTPPGGVVLDPFVGSGTTAEACVLEGFRCIAVEQDATYLPLTVARLSKPLQPTLDGAA